MNQPRQFDSPGRYHVPSSDNGAEPYLVDLCAFTGNGECSCPHFQYRILPSMQERAAGRNPNRNPLHCKHITEAREQLATDVIAKLIAQEQGGPAHGKDA